MDVPHRDTSINTPSATGAFASIVPEGVDQRGDHSVMSLSFMRGAPIASSV
jgi:hypothetical protein